jgi:hypothetical protein
MKNDICVLMSLPRMHLQCRLVRFDSLKGFFSLRNDED